MPAVSAAAATTTTASFDISQLPSLKKGMTSKEESDKRRRTCRFIEEAGRVLKLPRYAVATAMVFFHRFYACHAFQEHDRFEVAVAALVLAAKTEEAPKKLNTVIQDCYKLKTRAMQAGRLSQQRNGGPKETSGGAGGNVTAAHESTGNLDTKGEEFLKLKERILLLERIILHTIGFELSIDHPYKFFMDQIKKLVRTRKLKYNAAKSAEPTTDSSGLAMTNELVQYSVNIANDSYHTSLCLQFEAKQIATACVYLACMFTGVEPTNGDWRKTLFMADDGGNGNVHANGDGYTQHQHHHPDDELEALVSISVQMIDAIAHKKASDTESVRKIRVALGLLRSGHDGSSPVRTSGAGSPRPPPPPPPPSASGPGSASGSASPHKRPRVS
eukprot:CAMPEP_0172364184 /NCGR_PEP_ID=MMETSP1060-20121228/7370_1 /TAXON_ID=37318 /ORGANISM="Pseudo-nitzschia pungens, Strain cf. cingulata" /LENGTH=386 /DNA_ID=CAMNT_0013087135 /DNA_START=598 /DNA_END=1758 /DNA_ORIENTATION=+